MPTYDTNILVTTTGIDVGSTTARVDVFAQDMNISGTETHAGTSTLDTAVIGNLNNVLYVDGSKYALTPAGIAAAYAALPSTGGIIEITDDVTLDSALTFGTNNKPVILRGHGHDVTLTYTPTSGTAITIDWGTSQFGIGGFENLRLVGPGSGTAVGIAAGTTNQAALVYFQGVKISGFATGFSLPASSDMWSSTFSEGAVSGCTTGFLFAVGVENFRIENSDIFQNTTGISVTNSTGEAQIHLLNNSFDDNTTTAISVTGNGAILGFGNHFENAGLGTAQYVTLNDADARFTLYGGRFIDNVTSGTQAQFVTVTAAANVLIDGTTMFSAGRTVTQAVNLASNPDATHLRLINYSPSLIPLEYNSAFAGRILNIPQRADVTYPTITSRFYTWDLESLSIPTRYNGIATVSNGVPSEYATVDLTAQTAAVGTTTLYAVPASGAGQYRVSWNAKVTTAATTGAATSTLGALTIVYTDPDGVVQTITAAAQVAAGTIATSSTGNSTTTVLIGLPLTLNCKASTNITYAMAYASDTANQMAYNLHLKVEALG